MSYNEAVNYLYNLQKYGIKLGLDNISRLAAVLDNPQESFLSVHVAGTNGKGSTSAIIASILQAAGLRVGLFTSPHLVSFTERIRVNGDEITENEVVHLAEEIRDIVSQIDDLSPTFFEVVTALAMLHFKRQYIDIAVMEVGMGGRLDATNIMKPEVSVITNISYDHKEFLGNTLEEIAREKAGIIKKGVPVVVSTQEPEALSVIEKAAREKNVDLYIFGRDFSSELKSGDSSGIVFTYSGSESFMIDDLVLPLAGEHQMQNASVAIKAFELINERTLKPAATHHYNVNLQLPTNPPFTKGGQKGDGHNSSDKTHHFIREGLKKVRWPGRLEFVHDDPPMLIDGAHNPAAASVLAKALRNSFLGKYKKIIMILGIMGDKDAKGIMEPLLPLASEVILTSPSYSRAASPEKLAVIAASLGFSHVHIAPTVKEAIDIATKDSRSLKVTGGELEILNSEHRTLNSSLILITGSFYTIGEAKEVLGQKGVLSSLRE